MRHAARSDRKRPPVFEFDSPSPIQFTRSIMKVIPRVIFPVCLEFLAPGLASGDTVSNFTNEKNQTCKPFVVSDTTLVAGSFTTGRFGGGYKLDEIFLSIVSVTLNPAANNPGGRFRVQLWNDVEGGLGGSSRSFLDPRLPPKV